MKMNIAMNVQQHVLPVRKNPEKCKKSTLKRGLLNLAL